MTIYNLPLKTSKQQPLHRLIYALGIRFAGETTAKTLANAVKEIFDFETMSVEELQQLEDIGIKVATSIYGFFRNEDNVQMLKRLQELGSEYEEYQEANIIRKQYIK